MRRFVVADDLTGASDAGVQFAKTGLSTVVWLDHGDVPDADAQVLVLDMDSRAVAPEVAYGRMRDALARLRPRTPREIVKKMDSTLRGNVGPELRALLEALPDAFAIVCPAYPKNKRVTRDGVLLVDGTPVDRTDFGRDLFSPVRDARVAAHLDVAAATLDLRTVRAGTTALSAAIDDARARGLRVAVADAERDEDLRALAALDGVRDDLLWVGSAGLIEMLHDHAPRPAPRPEAVLHHVRGPIVFLIGSISAMTQRQIEDYAAHGHGLTERLDPLAVVQTTMLGAVTRAHEAIAHRRDVLLALDADRTRVEATLAWGAERGWDAAATSRRLLESFTAAAGPLITDRTDAAVVLSGGDVARAFCTRHGVRGMRLLAEAAPGIPVSRAIGAPLLLVTKAGGFGRPQTYRDIASTLHPQVTTA